MSEANYEDRVKKGAALLDRVIPGWAEKIATDRLAMSSCFRCILGQLYGVYDNGVQALDFNCKTVEAEGASHGFILDLFSEGYQEVMGKYDILADAWRAEIRARIEAATVGQLRRCDDPRDEQDAVPLEVAWR